MKEFDFSQPVGIALGSGAARGLAHIGVLKGLEAAGVQVGYIAGTSMGALIGAAYAAGIPVAELEQIIDELNTRKLLKLFAPKFSRFSIISDRTIMDLLDSLYRDLNIEDLHIPFRAVAVNFATGERVVFSRGKLIDAVRASISIPMIFHQVERDGKMFVDGGLVDPVPVAAVTEMGASYVIAVPVITSRLANKVQPPHTINRQGNAKSENKLHLSITPFVNRFSRFLHKHKTNGEISDNGLSEEERSYHLNFLNALTHTISISGSEIARLHLEANPPDLIIRPAVGWLQMWEFHKAKEAIVAGEEAVKIALQQIQ